MDKVYGYHTNAAAALVFTVFLDRKASIDIRSMSGSGNCQVWVSYFIIFPSPTAC